MPDIVKSFREKLGLSPSKADRTKTTLTDGSPVTPDHREIQPDGQQKAYVVLRESERAKGFVRPFRDMYRHVGRRPKYPTRPLTAEEIQEYADDGWVAYEEYPPELYPKKGRYWTKAELDSGCGTVTTMGRALSETYARDPGFYGATFCCQCRAHFPVGEKGEFVWLEMDGREGPKVGT